MPPFHQNVHAYDNLFFLVSWSEKLRHLMIGWNVKHKEIDCCNILLDQPFEQTMTPTWWRCTHLDEPDFDVFGCSDQNSVPMVLGLTQNLQRKFSTDEISILANKKSLRINSREGEVFIFAGEKFIEPFLCHFYFRSSWCAKFSGYTHSVEIFNSRHDTNGHFSSFSRGLWARVQRRAESAEMDKRIWWFQALFMTRVFWQARWTFRAKNKCLDGTSSLESARLSFDTYPSQIFLTRVFSCSPWKKMRNTDLYTWSPWNRGEKHCGTDSSKTFHIQNMATPPTRLQLSNCTCHELVLNTRYLQWPDLREESLSRPAWGRRFRDRRATAFAQRPGCVPCGSLQQRTYKLHKWQLSNGKWLQQKWTRGRTWL